MQVTAWYSGRQKSGLEFTKIGEPCNTTTVPNFVAVGQTLYEKSVAKVVKNSQNFGKFVPSGKVGQSSPKSGGTSVMLYDKSEAD